VQASATRYNVQEGIFNSHRRDNIPEDSGLPILIYIGQFEMAHSAEKELVLTYLQVNHDHRLANIEDAIYENTAHNEMLTVCNSICGYKILQLILTLLKPVLLNFQTFLETGNMSFNRDTFDQYGAMFMQPPTP
jgi:hypothetical protein